MNAVDAGATVFQIGIKNERVILMDNGRGFQSEEEIASWFDVLGAPHSEEEKARKTYGTFRIGRGQLFAYGKNTWKTEKYRMLVDVKTRGQEYEFEDDAKHVDGCTIIVDLYNKLNASGIAETEQDIRMWCKYMPIDVYLNDKLISQDATKAKWDFETDDAYVKLTKHNSLAVYNLGVLVKDYPTYTLGTGGIIVSKQQLKVNFARNDVQSDCPVWKRIKTEVNKRATNRNTRTKSLDDGGRQRLANQLLLGELPFSEVRDKRLITAATGRHYSLAKVAELHYGYPCVTNAPKGNILGDRLMKQKTAFVIADETLQRFRVESVAELLILLKDMDKTYGSHYYQITPEPFEELIKGYNSDFTTLDPKEMTLNAVSYTHLTLPTILLV